MENTNIRNFNGMELMQMYSLCNVTYEPYVPFIMTPEEQEKVAEFFKKAWNWIKSKFHKC